MLRLLPGAANIPHIAKTEKGGDDAWAVVTAGLGALVVADGVSGWASEGVDAAAYARALVGHATAVLEDKAEAADPRATIRTAHHATKMPGSSTLCVAVMQPGGRLSIANLGDSGVRLIRDGAVVFRTKAQQHSFNTPYQLSHPVSESADDAGKAETALLVVRPGDVVVLATDGLFDNVFDDEVAQIVGRTVSERLAAPAPLSDAPYSGGSGGCCRSSSISSDGVCASGSSGSSGISGSVCASGSSGSSGSVCASGSSAGSGGRASSGSSGRGCGSGGGACTRPRLLLLRPPLHATNGHNHYHSAPSHQHQHRDHQQHGGHVCHAPALPPLSRLVTSAAAEGRITSFHATAVARALATTAHAYAGNPCRRTPWSVAALDLGEPWAVREFAAGGGKMDDITVVVAFVV
ncbi:hypothetical protein FOA52_013627 [Chlamydomonas sp. UWO 241]|nr:hypothetical protein FOA52_013627 [Chlamydomonas sp. UWO 241]